MVCENMRMAKDTDHNRNGDSEGNEYESKETNMYSWGNENEDNVDNPKPNIRVRIVSMLGKKELQGFLCVKRASWRLVGIMWT